MAANDHLNPGQMPAKPSRKAALRKNDVKCWKCRHRVDASEAERGDKYAPVVGIPWQHKDTAECARQREAG
jgi:hypothetical protein